MSDRILVINPNSNEAVTAGLDDALAPFRMENGPEIECVTLKEGPFGVESQLDADSVILPLASMVKAREDAGAYVIACYSDPGLDACRSVTKKPVFGIQEAAVLTALSRADLFGVIAIADGSIPRHRRAMTRMGVLGRLAGELALNISVDESARGAGHMMRLLSAARRWRRWARGRSSLAAPAWRATARSLRRILAAR